MEIQRFDEWTRSLATDQPTRRTVVKAIAGAGVAALALLRGHDLASAACSGDRCKDTSGPCGGSNKCACYRRRGGGSKCLSLNRGICNNCRDDRDCKGGWTCVQSGPECCRKKYDTACVAPC